MLTCIIYTYRMGRTALHIALTPERPNVGSVKALLSVMTNCDPHDNAGDTPLHIACTETYSHNTQSDGPLR